MYLLFLSSWFPQPADTGSKLRILNLLKCLSKHHHVTFLAFSRAGEVSRDRMEALRSYGKILPPVVLPRPWPVIGKVLPNPRWHSQEMRARIQETTTRQRFDAVLASEILAGFYGAEVPGVPRFLDNCELTVLIERCTREPSLVRRLRSRVEWRSKRNFTASLVRRYDACAVVSEQERNHLLDLGAEPDRVLVVPNGVDIEANVPKWGPAEPCTLVYAGALTFHANLDAMEFFVNAILPLIRRTHPQALLRITGEYQGVDLRRLPHGEKVGVQLTGPLSDVRPCVAGSVVCVVPLRVGGGTRLKILEAMALGTPVVSTSKGAEGLQVSPGKDILLTDTPEQFAAAVCRLLDDGGLRQAITESARRTVVERYDWRRCIRPVLRCLDQLQTKPIQGRKEPDEGAWSQA